jgi:hypothetical protein
MQSVSGKYGKIEASHQQAHGAVMERLKAPLPTPPPPPRITPPPTLSLCSLSQSIFTHHSLNRLLAGIYLFEAHIKTKALQCIFRCTGRQREQEVIEGEENSFPQVTRCRLYGGL